MTNRLPDPPHSPDPATYDWNQQLAIELQEVRALAEQGAGVAAGEQAGGVSVVRVTEPGDQTNSNTSTPPAVANFSIIPGSDFIALLWDIPSAGSEVSYTEIARGTINPPDVPTADIAQANVRFIASPNGYHVDTVGRGSPIYFYFARHVRDLGGVKIEGPWTVSAVQGSTAADLQYLLDLFEGQLTESQLTATLSSRINLIDAVGTGLVDRLNAEETTRIAEISRVETEYVAADDAISAQIDSLVLASGGRIFREDDPPDPNTHPDAPFVASDRWIDTNDGNQPYIWDPSAGDEVSPPYRWVSIRDQAIVANAALIATQQQAILDLDANKAEASLVNTINTTLGQNSASIQELLTSRDGVEAEYAIVLDVNGHVAGVGLINSGVTSQFIINAGSFFVTHPNQPTTPLFVIGLVDNEPQAVFNARVHLGDASVRSAAVESLAADKLFALSGTIAEAIIDNGHITNAMIANVIQSDNWNTLTKQGWRLTKSAGLFEGRGITIYDAQGTAIFGSGTGYALNWGNVNGANKPEDNATDGAVWGDNLRGIPFVQESFENSAKWTQIAGEGAFSYVVDSSARFGGRVLRATGRTTILYADLIPFDEAATYRFRVRVRATGNNRSLSIGFFGYAGDGSSLRNINGGTLEENQYYVLARNLTLANGAWVELEAYVAGYSTGNGTLGDGTPANPGTLHPNVRSFRPVLLLNQDSAASTAVTQVDRFLVEKIGDYITADNVSTFIRDAAIGTLLLDGNAVTVTTVATGGPLVGNGATLFVTSVTLSLNVPAAVLIDWSFNQGFLSGAAWGVEIREQGGATLLSRIGLEDKNDFPSSKISTFGAAGTHTYELYWYGEDSDAQLAEGTITATAAKR